MTSDTTPGIRVGNDTDGYLLEAVNSPGAYGRCIADTPLLRCHPDQLHWQVTAPDGSGCSLNPAIHTVTEHDDGTITVHPSIVTSTWHGWLRAGTWESV